MMSGLHEFLQHPVIKQLLSFDVVFYGSVVAQALAGQHPIDFFRQSGVATGWAPMEAMVYLDRFLHPIIVSRDAKPFGLAHVIHEYVLEVEQEVMEFDIHFFDNVDAQDTMPSKLCLDVDNICVSRSGLWVYDKSEDVCLPSSLANAVARCESKTFGVSPSAVRPFLGDKDIMDRIVEMRKSGWAYSSSPKMRLKAYSGADVCSICHEPLSTGVAVETWCGHMFHRDCWSTHVMHSYNRNEETLASVPFAFGSNPISSSGAVYVNCCLCRSGCRAWEAIPPCLTKTAK